MQSHKLITNSPFHFEAGGSIDRLEVVYHTSPHSRRPGEKVVWICHALTANSDPEDWWPELVGPGKFFDTDKYYIVCANMLGSPYGSSSPASINPETGKPYLLSFPRVTVRDIVNANILVRKELGIESIDLILGASIGGFQAIEWVVMEPDAIKKCVFVASDVRVSPYLTAYEEAQRMAIEADPTFREAADLKGGETGLRCARAIALISYRNYECYCKSQAEADDDTLFAGRAASYERYQGKKLSDRFDAYTYWYLADSVDSHNIGRGRGGVENALKSVKAEMTVVGIDSDDLFPASQMRAIAAMLPGSKYLTMTSIYGHDGFLLETGQIELIMKPLLENK